MSDSPLPETMTEQERIAVLFANLVMQQTNMALMLLGRMPDPQTGKHTQDLDAARFFIDQLEMLEVKTKGNLDPREDQMLKQNLMSLRMAYVETVEAAAQGAAGPTQSRAQPKEPSPAGQPAASGEPAPDSGAEGERRTKFSKKY
jgi:hypothetical protein